MTERGVSRGQDSVVSLGSRDLARLGECDGGGGAMIASSKRGR